MTQHLHRAMEHLKEHLLALGSIVERNLSDSLTAFAERDRELATQVINSDDQIDLMEVEIEEECLKLLALYQPVALDLRFVVSMLKINSDLERVGDFAVKIGRTVLHLADVAPERLEIDLSELATHTQHLLRESRLAVIEMDCGRARKVLEMDDVVDLEHRRIGDEVRTHMRSHPNLVDAYLAVLSVARSLERIGDHATNIAEDVLYLVEGGIVRHGRTLVN